MPSNKRRPVQKPYLMLPDVLTRITLIDSRKFPWHWAFTLPFPKLPSFSHLSLDFFPPSHLSPLIAPSFLQLPRDQGQNIFYFSFLKDPCVPLESSSLPELSGSMDCNSIIIYIIFLKAINFRT